MIQWLILSGLLGFRAVWAGEPTDENADLGNIPSAVSSQKKTTESASTSSMSGKSYLEDALTGWSNRSNLLVPVPIENPSWQNRLSLDLAYEWQFSEPVKVVLSDRLNGYLGNTISLPSEGSLRNDFREGYLSYEAVPRTYLEAGRINVKSGTALGFNPTDFFKPRTNVNIASIDPSALREDRLGVVMLQAQTIWDQGSAKIAYAPKLQTATPMILGSPASFDPLFGQTNSAPKFLATLNYDIAELSPQALVFADDVGTHMGLNLSRVFGSSVVGYVEWSGVKEANLTTRALAFGKSTGTLPEWIPPEPQEDPNSNFQNDLSVGVSWTSAFKLTVNLEYHFHQAGLNGDEFNQWVALGSEIPALVNELWFVRQYASIEQEPLMQHEIFLRLDYPDLIASKLNLSAVAFVSPYDGSTLSQISTQYFFSRNWTMGAYFAGAFGSPATVQGSLPWAYSGVLQWVRYL